MPTLEKLAALFAVDPNNFANYKEDFSPDHIYKEACMALLDKDFQKIASLKKAIDAYNLQESIYKFAQKIHTEQVMSTQELMDINLDEEHMKLPVEERVKQAQHSRGLVALAYTKTNEVQNHINVPRAELNIAKRANLVNDPESKKAYLALSKLVDKDFLKVAHMCEKLDRSNNLYPYNQGDLKAPLLEILANPVMQKKAFIKIAGNDYSEEDLKRVPRTVFTQVLGGVPTDFTKLSEHAQYILHQHIKGYRSE